MDKKNILSTLVLILALISPLFAEEEFTITTYYPSPYGSYNELTTYSNTYLAMQSGNVGIGTSNPTEKLAVKGNIALLGGTPTYRVTNVAEPIAGSDVATKAYVDAKCTGQSDHITVNGLCSGMTDTYPPMPACDARCPDGYVPTGRGSGCAGFGPYGCSITCERW